MHWDGLVVTEEQTPPSLMSVSRQYTRTGSHDKTSRRSHSHITGTGWSGADVENDFLLLILLLFFFVFIIVIVIVLASIHLNLCHPTKLQVDEIYF